MAQRPQPSLRLADGGSFITRWAQSVRLQDGGVVPGSGRGDKIPAKYEPGEFVVSNDMIDDNPGLREQLSGLRAETLAARGKTVEEADAKALRYHGGLRGGEYGQETRDEELPAAHAGGRDFQRLDGASDNFLLGRGGGAQGVRNAQVSLRANSGGTYDPSKGRDLIARPNFIRPDGPPAYQPPPQISGPAPGTSLQVPPQKPNFTMGGPEVIGSPRPSSRINVGAEDVLPKSAPPPRAPANALVRTADIGRNGYTPNFQMGGRPPEGPRPLPAADAAAYDASPEGRATSRQFHQEKFAQAGGGSRVPPTGAPTAAPAAGAAPAAPSAASKWFGSADEWKKTLSPAADSPHKTLRMTAPGTPSGLGKGMLALQGAMGAKDAYEGLQEGDAWKAGVGAADAVAGAALFTPAAPVAGAYLGLRGAYDTAKMAGGAIYDRLSEGTQDVIGGTVNQIGLNTGLWGVDDSAKMQMGTAAPTTLRKTAPGAPTQARPEDTFAGPPESARSPVGDKIVFGAGSANAPNPGNVTRNGNSYEGTNVSGDITVNGFAPGAGLNLGSTISPQNMRAADNLAGGDSLRGQGAALSGQPGGSGVPAMPQTMHSGNDWASRNALRNLRVSAGSIYDSQSQWGNKAKAAADVGAYQNALAMDTAKQAGADPGSVARTTAQANMFGSKATADASKETSRNSLRGTMYTADSQLGGKQMDSQRRLREQQMTGMLWRESGGDPSKFQSLAMQYGLADTAKLGGDMASASQTRDYNASNTARKRLEGMAVRDDGKGGTAVDPGRLARLESTLGKMAPGWQHMSEREQAKHLATAEAGVNLLEGLNDRRNNSFWQSIGVDGASASLDNLPIESMKGGKLTTVGAVDGALTGGGVARNDYAIETKDGRKLYLPRGKVNQGELELLKSRGVDISGLQK